MPTPPVERSPASGRPADQLRLLIEAQTDYALFLLDPEGRILTWNPGAERIKGYAADEIIGEHFSRFYTEPDIARDHPANELRIAVREGRYEEEGWRVRKDGTRFWANVIITALFDAGEHVGFGKVTRDLSERRAAQQALEASERRARLEADRQRRRTAALEEVGRAIAAALDIEQIVQIATDAATALIGAAFGAFYAREPGGASALGAVSGAARDTLAPAFAAEHAVRSDDVTADPRYGRSPVGGPPVRSFLAVPVVTSAGEVAGALAFGHPDAAAFDEEHEAAATSVARFTAVALVNAGLLAAARREAEARQRALEERDHVARVLQQSLLPPDLPAIRGLELGSHYRAGTELVGGDYYDAFSLGDGRWGLVVGDVCGNGPEAASRTALTRHSVRTAAMFDADPAHVLGALNTALLGSGSDRFTTAVFARVEPRDGGATVCVASGGHPPVIVCRADGTTQECRAPGPLLGVVDPVALETREVELARGDLLVLYTDGLIEARRPGGRLFGLDRLREAVAECRDLPLDRLAEELAARASAFAGARISDDIAIVAVRVI